MLLTVARCARQIRWPCYQRIPHKAQNFTTKNLQKRHAHGWKSYQVPERNIVGVRNEPPQSQTDGQMKFLL